MTNDMSGAGAILAAMLELCDVGCTAAVSACLMCTDNRPSGTALAMGDVLTTRGGTSVPVWQLPLIREYRRQLDSPPAAPTTPTLGLTTELQHALPRDHRRSRCGQPGGGARLPGRSNRALHQRRRRGRPPAAAAWDGTRVLYLQHPSDPIVWWSTDLALRRPDWLREPRGRDVLDEMIWIPLVSFWQISDDLPLPPPFRQAMATPTRASRSTGGRRSYSRPSGTPTGRSGCGTSSRRAPDSEPCLPPPLFRGLLGWARRTLCRNLTSGFDHV